MDTELTRCVKEWVSNFGQEKGVDTSGWQVRGSETEFAVCCIPSSRLAEELAQVIKSECAAEATILDRHPGFPHWCVMSLATVKRHTEGSPTAAPAALED